MKIGVIGCGNVGFSHLLWLSKQNEVLGFDIDDKVKSAIMTRLGHNSVANSIADLQECESIHICVPTERAQDGSADMSIYEQVIHSLNHSLRARQTTFVVQRSTCPPGTADRYASFLGPNISYGVNPSFLRKSSIQQDTEQPERIAFGGDEPFLKHLEEIYKPIEAPIFKSENRSAVELLKYIENSLDSLLVSFWNEMLEYASQLSINTQDFVQILNKISDRPKFQSVLRVPGKAFGLWCLPKDLSALLSCMEQVGIKAPTLQGALDTNNRLADEVGVNETPASLLWTGTHVQANEFYVLPDGVTQIDNYIKNNAYKRRKVKC